MGAPYTQIYVHYVWATWERLPLVTPAVEENIYACIVAKCRDLKCETIAIGGIEDHVHLLVRFSPNTSVSQLIKEVKGASSHLMTHKLLPEVFFKWQGGYGAFTVSEDRVPDIVSYIRKQKAHHVEQTLHGDWEKWEGDE